MIERHLRHRCRWKADTVGEKAIATADERRIKTRKKKKREKSSYMGNEKNV